MAREVFWAEDLVGDFYFLYLEDDHVRVLHVDSEKKSELGAPPVDQPERIAALAKSDDKIPWREVDYVAATTAGDELDVHSRGGKRAHVDLNDEAKFEAAFAALKARIPGARAATRGARVGDVLMVPGCLLGGGGVVGGILYAAAMASAEGEPEIRGRRQLIKRVVVWLGSTLGTTGVLAIFVPLVALGLFLLVRRLASWPQVKVIEASR